MLQEGLKERSGVCSLSLHFPWVVLDLVLFTRCMTQCNFLSLLDLRFFSFITSSRIVFPASKNRVNQGASRTVKHRPWGSHGSFYPLTPDQESQKRWSVPRRLGMSVGPSSRFYSGISHLSKLWPFPSTSTPSPQGLRNTASPNSGSKGNKLHH